MEITVSSHLKCSVNYEEPAKDFIYKDSAIRSELQKNEEKKAKR